MKKKHIFILSGLLTVATAATVVGVVLGTRNANKVSAMDTNWEFSTGCANWYNSGKGFKIEFTYEIKTPATDEGNYVSVTPIVRIGAEDTRILNSYGNRIYVDDNGKAYSNRGNIIKNDSGTYTYTVMFSEFDSGWNTGVDGTETVTKLYFRWGNLELTQVGNIELIDSRLNVVPKAEIRDESTDNVKGLMFKSYIGTALKENAKYGMAIVPNEYLGKMTNNYCDSLISQGKDFIESYCNPHEITSGDTELYNRYGGGYYIKYSMVGIKEENYLREFSAIPFEEINGIRTYAWNINDFDENCSSVYNVCSRNRKNGVSLSTIGNEYVNGILNNVKNRTPSLSTTHVNTYIVDNTVQILKNQSLSNGDQTLSFKAAKGESETGQLILTSSTPGTLRYFAGVSDLVNGSNIITTDNIEVSMQHYVNITKNWSGTAEHTSFLSDLYKDDGVETPTLLRWWPDALIPMHSAVRDGRNVINPTYGNNQGLFFRINVPENAAAGTYTGNVAIYIVDQGLITVPVSLRVNNFSIANRKDSNNIMILSKSEINALYPSISYNNVCDSIYYSNAYNMLKDRGISGGLVPKSWVNSNFNDYIQVVKDYVQNSSKTDSYLLEFNQSHVTMKWTFRTGSSSTSTRTIDVDEDVFALENFTDGDGNTRIGLKNFLRALFDESTNDCDLLKGCVLYDPHADEPSTPSAYVRNLLNYNVVRCAIDAVAADVASVTGKDSVKQSLQNVFYLMTAGPEQGISGTKNAYAFCDVKSISNVSVANGANCCCATLSDIKYKTIKDFTPNMMWDWNSGIDWESHSYKESDKKTPKASCGYCYDGLAGIYAGTDTENRMWEYTCVQPVAPYPSYILNTPMIRCRINRWRETKLNMQGFMYYMVNRASYHDTDGSETVLTEAEILNGGIYYGDASSDGLLIYPVYNTLNYTNKNLYWLSSLRLENTAESNDDVNYLNYAKELITSKGTSTDLATLNSIYASLYGDATGFRPSSVTTNSSTFKTARNNLISLIEDLVAR